MVGTAVDKGVTKFGGVIGDCNDTVVTIKNMNGTNVTIETNSGACMDDAKLQVAMAVTLMVGIIQVGLYHELIFTEFFIHFFHLFREIK